MQVFIVMGGCDLAEFFTAESKIKYFKMTYFLIKINYFSMMDKINTWNSQLWTS